MSIRKLPERVLGVNWLRRSRIGRLQQEGTPQQIMTNNNWKYRIPRFANQVTGRLTADMSSVRTFPRVFGIPN